MYSEIWVASLRSVLILVVGGEFVDKDENIERTKAIMYANSYRSVFPATALVVDYAQSPDSKCINIQLEADEQLIKRMTKDWFLLEQTHIEKMIKTLTNELMTTANKLLIIDFNIDGLLIDLESDRIVIVPIKIIDS